MWKRFWWLWTLIFLCGCSVEKQDASRVQELEYAVVEETLIPEELAVLIQEKKQQPFKMTLDTGGERYLAVGYGQQETGGYSISVEELYVSSNAVYFKTCLIGPAKGETVAQAFSYPFIVVKIPAVDKSVVFQ